MPWLQIALLIFKLLKLAKSANSQEEFVNAAQASNSPLAANGAFLRLLWENRAEIIAEVIRLYTLFFAKPDVFHAPPAPGAAGMVDSASNQEAEIQSLVEELKN